MSRNTVVIRTAFTLFLRFPMLAPFAVVLV
jgi:hypothetical protein